MPERAHPEHREYQDRRIGLFKKIPNRFRVEMFRRYKFCNKYIKGKIVADIPCGNGWGNQRLKGAKHIYGFDYATDAVAYANGHYRSKMRSFKVGDMTRLKLTKNKYDVIMCLDGIEHINKLEGEEFIQSVIHGLKDGGLFILNTPILNRDGRGTKNPYHKHEYAEAEIIELLVKYFSIKKIDIYPGPELRTFRFVGTKCP